MLWFNFIPGLNFISLCFKLIIIDYHTPKQRKIKFKARIKLNHNIYIYITYHKHLLEDTPFTTHTHTHTTSQQIYIKNLFTIIKKIY